MKQNYIIPIFVPHQGCKNECVFCNQKSISGENRDITKEDVKRIVETYLKNFTNPEIEKEIAFFGGSFTGIDKERQIELLEAANQFIIDKKVSSIRISTRPDYINKEILKYLKKYNVKTIELGVQSAYDYILKKAKRGHTFEDVKKASKLIRWHGFTLGHQVMIGLPESTKQDEINTAKLLVKLKPKIVRIYPVLVIKNTGLEKMLETGEYEALTLEQAVDRSKEVYYIFNEKKVKIIRVGLQESETISKPKTGKSEVVAGPYHPAFRQLVEAEIWYDAVVSKIKAANVKVKEVLIRVGSENLNNVIGHKRQNLNKIKDLYDVQVKVESDDNIKSGQLDMQIISTYNSFLEE